MESHPEFASSLTTLFSTQSSGPHQVHPQLQDDLRTLESWERKWLMSIHTEKCQPLTVTGKRNRIPNSYTLPNQTLERVARAKFFGVQWTETLHCGKHIQSTAAPAKWARIQEPEGTPRKIATKALCVQCWGMHLWYGTIIIIIINPLTVRVVGAPQMILQPVFSISMCMSWVEWTAFL